jgi:HSP20 family molecular chaperone IbpA
MNSQLQTSERQGNAPAHTRENGQRREQPFVVPPVDVFENESGITLLADLPGVSRDRLGVRVDGDNLVIEATAETPQPQEMQLVYGEARYASYRRQFTLSRELDASRIDATLMDGVLKLSIPKLEEARPRRVEVRVG